MKWREHVPIGSLGWHSRRSWVQLSSARRAKHRQRCDARRGRRTPARGCIGCMTMIGHE
jgi:hypothetical protein